MIIKPPSRHGSLARERGVSLMFALLALVSLSLASVALVRSVDTSALVMGNLGFKQDTTAAADKAAQTAIAALLNTVNRDADNTAAGYYATAHESIDATGQQTSDASRELINWGINNCAGAVNAASATCTVSPSPEIEDTNGNKMRYVIFRLCSATGAPGGAGNVCARPKTIPAGSGAGGSGTGIVTAPKRGEVKYGGGLRLSGNPAAPAAGYQGVYYRIVVRVIGARDTTSFVETIVHQ